MIGCDESTSSQVSPKSKGLFRSLNSMDEACDLLECMDPFSGDFTCQCDIVVDILESIPTESDVAKALGITPKLVDMAADCCPSGSALDLFNQCFADSELDLLLPSTPASEKPSTNTDASGTQPTLAAEQAGGSDEKDDAASSDQVEETTTRPTGSSAANDGTASFGQTTDGTVQNAGQSSQDLASAIWGFPATATSVMFALAIIPALYL